MLISKQAERIFLEALELPADRRDGYVTDACGGDERLQQEVSSLLTAAPDSEAFFSSLADRVGLTALASAEEPLPERDQIGAWRLLRLIGRGGMGAVYLAERADGQFEKRAALKLLPVGIRDEPSRRRFLAERQILARLLHDNITRLLDGGITDDGTPWFAMDYVEGLPIDQYCDEQGLDIDRRLELLLKVCNAVEYAHRNLVVHRDIKPSNVLVDESGQVRLLDFGIAKLEDLEEKASPELTQLARRPMTPGYASPEMLLGEPVDVTTDVYSLGVLAYRLLTGHMPLQYQGLSAAQMEQRARQDIPRPASEAVHLAGESQGTATRSSGHRGDRSRLSARLRGDLDLILATALAKDRDARYGSVEQLSHDIRRHLEGLPILARAPTLGYRAGKFLRRHRAGVAVASLTFLSLVAVAVVSVRFAIVTERQGREIAAERDRAAEIRDFLVSIFDSANPDVAPADLTAREILDGARERIGAELAGQPDLQADMLAAMSEVYLVTRRTEEGREVLAAERTLRESLGDRKDADYADMMIRWGLLEDFDGNYERSLDYGREALLIYTKLADRLGIARAKTRISRVLHLQGDYEGAEPGYREAMAIYDAELDPGNDDANQMKLHLGALLAHTERFEEAHRILAEALAERERRIEGDSSAITEALLPLASVLNRLGRRDDAIAAYRRALAMNDRLYGVDNRHNSFIINGMGKVYEDQGDLETAAEHYVEAARLIGLHFPASPNLGIAMANLGKVYVKSDRWQLAAEAFREAVTVLEQGLPSHWILGDVRWRLGACLIELGDYDAAESMILEGLPAVVGQWGDDHPAARHAKAAAARLYEAMGRPEEARRYLGD